MLPQSYSRHKFVRLSTQEATSVLFGIIKSANMLYKWDAKFRDYLYNRMYNLCTLSILSSTAGYECSRRALNLIL